MPYSNESYWKHLPWVSLLAGLLIVTGCERKSQDKEPSVTNSSYTQLVQTSGNEEDLEWFEPIHIGAEVGDRPWIAHVRAVDLDQDGLMDVLACEAKHHQVLWLRQVAPGTFVEKVIGSDMRAPVHVEAADMDGDGDLDVLVSSMSVVFPNNDKIGAIFILENLGNGEFHPRLIIENIDRVTDVRAADFDGDGKMDLAVGQFGYDQGEVRWMRRTGPWTFESQILLQLSGTVNIGVADFDQNGTLDIVALVSQQWEEIHLFSSVGRPDYRKSVIWGSTNEDYSLSGMSLCDINQDGRMDILFTNGDGFGPNAEPGPKPWHGVQYLQNMGHGRFNFQRVGNLGGAYSPVGVDLDLDGHIDIVALSAFNDWEKPNAISMAWFRNNGQGKFERRILAYYPTHLMTVDAADFDQLGGRPWLVTGGFHAYPPYDHQSRLLLWKPK